MNLNRAVLKEMKDTKMELLMKLNQLSQPVISSNKSNIMDSKALRTMFTIFAFTLTFVLQPEIRNIFLYIFNNFKRIAPKLSMIYNF